MRKKRKVLRWSAILLIGIFVFGISNRAYAMSDDDIISIFGKFPEFFTTNNVIRDTGRLVAWSIVKGLAWLADQCTSLYKISLGFVDFTNYSSLNNYVSSLKGIFVAVLAVALCGLGVILIIDHEKKPKFLKSLFMMGIAISASSFLLTTLSTAVKSDAETIAGDEVIVSDVINTSIYDLLYIDQQYGLANMKKSNMKNYHYSGGVDIKKIDINEVINYKSDKITTSDAKDILSKKITYIYTSGDNYEGVLSDVYNGVGWNSGDDEDFLNEFYYRYKVDYFYVYISLVAICIVYICMSYKVIRLVFEIATGKILAVLYSANINGTQKTMRIFEAIINGYIVLLLTSVLIKLFTFAQQFINGLAPYDDYPVANCLLLLFLAFSVIDGPNIIQQITGIDAGLSSGFGKLVAAYHMAREAAHTVQTASMMNVQRQQLAAVQDRNQQNNQQQNNNDSVSMNGDANASSSVPPDGKSAYGDSSKKEDGTIQPDGKNSTGNGVPPSGASGQEPNSDQNLMGEQSLDQEGAPTMMQDDAKQPEMVNLDDDSPGITPNSMADMMNQDMNQYQDTNDFNGSSGLVVQNPATTTEDGWDSYEDNFQIPDSRSKDISLK